MNSDDDNHEEEEALNDVEEIKMESMEEPEFETFTQVCNIIYDSLWQIA